MHIDCAKPHIIIICGPTGIGKTALAVELAQTLGGEIISADSMQIYKYMDIGTAKPTPAEQNQVRHHLIDVVTPDQPFDAARFSSLARDTIKTLHQRHILPFVVGGTGLYIKALVHGLFRIRPADPDLLRQLETKARREGSITLYRQLQLCDPVTAQKIHPNDTFRIIRALEVFISTQKPISEYHARHRFAPMPYRVLAIGLHMPREELYRRIDLRVDLMIEEGLPGEVKKLLKMGYAPDLKSMQSIGYRHMLNFLLNGLAWEEAVRTMKRDTRRYAKRQLTWFRNNDPDLRWIEKGDHSAALKLIKHFLAHHHG